MVRLSFPSCILNVVKFRDQLEPSRRPIGSPEDAKPMKPKRSEPPTVLIVEDEPAVRDFAVTVIADEPGYRTLAAATGREAIAFLEDGETIDVMFTDIRLPDGPAAMDGLQLARKAVEVQPRLRVIYTTGGVETDRLTVEFVEGSTFLSKPYTAKQLVRALNDHVTRALRLEVCDKNVGDGRLVLSSRLRRWSGRLRPSKEDQDEKANPKIGSRRRFGTRFGYWNRCSGCRFE